MEASDLYHCSGIVVISAGVLNVIAELLPSGWVNRSTCWSTRWGYGYWLSSIYVNAQRMVSFRNGQVCF